MPVLYLEEFARGKPEAPISLGEIFHPLFRFLLFAEPLFGFRGSVSNDLKRALEIKNIGVVGQLLGKSVLFLFVHLYDLIVRHVLSPVSPGVRSPPSSC